MRGQGRYLSEIEVKKVVRLLLTTDLTMAHIAERMGCSKAAVIAINRKVGVRAYLGKRATWKLAS